MNIIILFSLLIYLAKAHKGCDKLLHDLAQSQKLFLFCVTTNSAPVTMCTSCADMYNDVLKWYDTLVADCAAIYFDKDRINLVPSTEAVLTGLWSKAYCDDCFNNNNSFVFDEKNSTFYGCLGQNDSNQCEACKNEYLDLNSFYINLDQHNNGEVCYDLQDSMNRTRNKWSKELKCCPREYNMTLFAIALSLTSCLPLLFYGFVYLLTKRRERNHGTLNDEDPLFNTTAPSTSGINRRNIIVDRPTQIPTNSSSTAKVVPLPKEPFNTEVKHKILNGDLDSSDDEFLISATINSKEKLK